MKTKQRLDGKKLCLALTAKLEADMRSFRRDKNIESESELVRQAIADYIYRDYDEDTLKLQGLKNVNEKITELRDMLNIIFKFQGFTHKNLLAYLPEIDPHMKGAALRSAAARYEKVINSFQDGLKDDPPMFERLLHKFYSEDANDR